MSGTYDNPLYLLECGDCSSVEFHLTVDKEVYCVKCGGKINARLIYGVTSSSPPTGEAPLGAA